jgi:hypothetical protein
LRLAVTLRRLDEDAPALTEVGPEVAQVAVSPGVAGTGSRG